MEPAPPSPCDTTGMPVETGGPGHVFVVKGDLTRLACDAWLLPTDSVLTVEQSWDEWLGERGLRRRRHEATTAWRRGQIKAEPVIFEGEEPGPLKQVPRPFYTDVLRSGTGPDRGVDAALDFVETATTWLAADPRRRYLDRARLLLGIPIVGTGESGGFYEAGGILDALLRKLERAIAAPRVPVDIVLVAYSDGDHAAAQRARRRLRASAGSRLGETLDRKARALASLASDGRLVVFLGAGVSQSAGLPGWKGLLDALAKEARIVEPGELEDLEKALSLQDLATLLEGRLRRLKGSDRALGDAVKEILSCRQHASLQHHLLASLPVTDYITTNYDVLFETAFDGGAEDRALSVLPHLPEREAGKWLLKLHGCVREPGDIVLTRTDYLRYEQRRAALAGIVQAMLLTKHMLFVGFSLTDENFHRIVDEVRRALPRGMGAPFGTVVTPGPTALLEELWGGELDVTGMDAPADAEARRRVEIFLDEVGAQSDAQPSYLMEPRWEGMRSESEKVLGQRLASLAIELQPVEDQTGPAWKALHSLLRKLGYVGVGVPVVDTPRLRAARRTQVIHVDQPPRR